jgi:hypothetical protein
MKILVREPTSELIWKDAEYKNGSFFDADNEYTDSKIYAVKDDNRNKIVICSGCGKEVRNTPAAINTHRNMINKPDKCFTCGELRTRNAKVTSQKYSINEDGTYNETTKRTVNLVCYNSWCYVDINSQSARNNCKYARCENALFKNIEDFWTRNPGAFDEFITIDRLIDSGYDDIRKDGNESVVNIKAVCKLQALINTQGICYGFQLQHQRNHYMIRYSKKYDKVWVVYHNSFSDFSIIDIAESTRESILNKLRKLYK